VVKKKVSVWVEGGQVRGSKKGRTFDVRVGPGRPKNWGKDLSAQRRKWADGGGKKRTLGAGTKVDTLAVGGGQYFRHRDRQTGCSKRKEKENFGLVNTSKGKDKEGGIGSKKSRAAML